MAGDNEIVFHGLWHLYGEVVRATILGLDCGTYTVTAEGSIAVPYGSDSGGLLTAAYLIANSNSLTGVENNVTFSIYNGTSNTSVTVPVVIGFDYTTQGQLLRPDVTSDIHSPLGPGLGKTRRVHMFAVLVQNAVEIDFGTDFTTATLLPARFTTGDGVTARAEDSPFSGVYWGTLVDNYSFEGQLTWEVDDPYPCTICSVSVFLDVEER